MRLHRFYLKIDLSGDQINISDKETINQIKNVFRLKNDDQFLVFNGGGQDVLVSILEITKDRLEAKIVERIKNDTKPKTEASLYCSILKKENFEMVVQKATEVGVSKIIPVISARTIKMNLNLDRLNKIAKEAAEQSGRNTIPEIIEPMKLENALQNVKKDELTVFFNKGGQNLKEIPVWQERNQVNIFIGPEGGWEDSEVEMAKENGFEIASLGDLTLRGETAAIIATYLAVNK